MGGECSSQKLLGCPGDFKQGVRNKENSLSRIPEVQEGDSEQQIKYLREMYFTQTSQQNIELKFLLIKSELSELLEKKC